ncbi:hypothetical protein BKA83DRAFT_4530946 [Pisolithus microcarpus]|nr:hypothetical protein BKA83DRAFT_4530946 [Pisolithus microcarpus]
MGLKGFKGLSTVSKVFEGSLDGLEVGARVTLRGNEGVQGTGLEAGCSSSIVGIEGETYLEARQASEWSREGETDLREALTSLGIRLGLTSRARGFLSRVSEVLEGAWLTFEGGWLAFEGDWAALELASGGGDSTAQSVHGNWVVHVSLVLIRGPDDWQSKVTMTLKFVRQCTSILATQVDAPALFLFTAQIASKCGSEFTNLAYDFYMQAFSMCEDSLGIGYPKCSRRTWCTSTCSSGSALVEDSHVISIDTVSNTIELHITLEEMERQRKAWKAPPLKVTQSTHRLVELTSPGQVHHHVFLNDTIRNSWYPPKEGS